MQSNTMWAHAATYHTILFLGICQDNAYLNLQPLVPKNSLRVPKNLMRKLRMKGVLLR